ncbi:MAG TPA: hypothetical protein DEF34_01440 [Desulfotomaculum sp.]|nr:hypothetical protein [Desulfotomaculum sp.]
MNYVREINAFADWLETNPLDAPAQALWYSLMAINNKCGWKEWFTVANLTLQAKVRVSKNTILKHRSTLVDKGLIEYENQGREVGKYRMVSLINNRSVNNTPEHEPIWEPEYEPIWEPECEPIESISGGNPPIRTPKRELTGNIRAIFTPNLEPVCEPNPAPLNKLNKNKLNQKDIYTIFRHWNDQKIITHRNLTEATKGHIRAMLAIGYTVEEIIAAIDNYAEVLNDQQYYWTHRWGLDEFLLRGVDKFKSASHPRTNFLKDKTKTPQQAQGGVDKYASYVNRIVPYDEL